MWQKHEYSFVSWASPRRILRRSGDKIKLLLIALRQQDAKSQPVPERNGSGAPDKFARASLTFYTLGRAEAETSRATKPVDGLWRPVSIADRSRETPHGRPEKMWSSLRSNVLADVPTTRQRRGSDHMVPHQDSGSLISLRFPNSSPRRRVTSADDAGSAGRKIARRCCGSAGPRLAHDPAAVHSSSVSVDQVM